MTVNHHFKNFDDIVFENRNKEYGAYYLRSIYRLTVLKAIVIVIVIFIVISLALFYFINYDPFSRTDNSIAYTIYINNSEINMLNPPPLKDEDPMDIENMTFPEKEKIKIPIPSDSISDSSKVLKSEKKENLPEDEKKENKEEVNPHSDAGNSNYPSDNSSIMVVAEALPSFPGGDVARINFIRYNINYPKEDKNKGLQGRVIVTFVVEKDGTLTNIKINQGLSAAMNNEALRVVKLMPKWFPGRQKGKPVRVIVKLPIKFSLK